MTGPLHSLPVAPGSILADLPWNLVELVPCPLAPAAGSTPGALAEIAFHRDAWLPGDTARLRALFGADEALEAIAAALGRTLDAVRTRICELGIRRNSQRPWTEMEDDELARRYGTEATSTLAAELGRTPGAVYARAGLLGLTEGAPPPYTDWELAQVRAGYAQGVPVAQLAALVGRPASGIATVASRLGVSHRNGPPDWGAEEQARALALAEEGRIYPAIAAALAAEGFPRRQPGAVGQALRKLGYARGWGRPWTGEEDDLFRHAYATGASLTPLRQRLGRGTCSIRYRAGELDLQGTHARPNGWRIEPAWSEVEILALRQGYGRVPTPELAHRLGRKKAGLYNKAHDLGLVHGYSRPFSADEDQAVRLARAHGISLSDLSDALGRDHAVVSKHAIRLGLPFADRPLRAPRGPRSERATWTLPAILALADAPIPAAPTPGPQAPSARRPASATRVRPPTPDATPVLLPAADGIASAPAWLLAGLERAGLLRAVARAGGIVLLAPAG